MEIEHKRLIREIYDAKDRRDGGYRTEALKQTFIDSLKNENLLGYRPDEIWTNLRGQYYKAELDEIITAFQLNQTDADALIEKAVSVRNGWVKSSGTAFENFIESHYDPIFQALDSPVKVRLLKKSNVRTLKPTNLGQYEMGKHIIDDLYLLVKNREHWVIWAMISVRAPNK